MFGLPLWAIWLILCGAFLLIEIFNISFLLIWPGIGSFFAFIASVLGAPIEIQLAVFAISTTIMIIFMKPLTKKLFKNKDSTKMNHSSLLFNPLLFLTSLPSTPDVGQVKVAGELWSAIALNDEKIKINEIVEVTKVDGVKLVVTKINENV